MNDEILKRLKKNNDNLSNYLTLRSSDKELDYLFENYLIGNKRRYFNEFNEAIVNNLYVAFILPIA